MATIETILETLNDHLDRTHTYETTHEDAGDAYAHLPKESGWGHGKSRKAFRDWIATWFADIDRIDMDDAVEAALSNLTMISDHVLSPRRTDDTLFVIDSYPVSEIEIPLPSTLFGGLKGEDLKTLIRSCDAVIHGDPETSDTVLGYMTTQNTWVAAITRDNLEPWLQQKITDKG